MSIDLNKLRSDFPALSQEMSNRPLVYLDNGATTFKPKAVINALEGYYLKDSANIHRGLHALSENATMKYEQSRQIVKNFINAQYEEEVIFTYGTTDGINLIAKTLGQNLDPGDEIIISAMEHHSNIVPWQLLREEKKVELKVIPVNDKGEIEFEGYLKLLTPRTKLVSVVAISNSLGSINPIKDIIDHAKKQGALTLVDGAQMVAHQKVDVQELDCDFFVFSGHKLFGPTGIGVLYGKKQQLNALPPYRGGGDMIEHVSFEKTTFAELPNKFEAGTPNIAGAIGLGAAIEYLNNYSWEDISQHENELIQHGKEELSKVSGLKFVGTAEKKTSIFSFVLEGIHPNDLGTFLSQQGIAVRTGHHCTGPILEQLGTPSTVRASLSFYNTKDEIDYLVTALKKAQEFFA